MYLTETLQNKWQPVLEHPDLPKIGDAYKRAVTTVILENQEKAVREDRSFMSEAAPANATSASIDNWDPVLISLVRRAMPNLIAYDVCGVQPMTGPTGLIFAMKSRYSTQGGTEALHDEANSAFSGGGTQGGESSSLGGVGAVDTTPADGVDDAFGFGTGVDTAVGEDFGQDTAFGEMSFSIEKATVTAKTRALKAEYTMELAQDLKAVHGLEAESELANILSSEILAEINREVVRTINSRAKLGCQQADLANAGVFDLDVDADGRWSLEKYKGLLVQIQREANQIAIETRRGKGNFILVSSDVAAILSASGMLDNTTALSGNAGISSDVTGTTMVGTLNGGVKVYLDPYATVNFVTVGYKGANAYDAGLFYAPYVPLTMVRAVNQDTFQPKIGFKTRYGMVANPFVGTTPGNDVGAVRSNQYYRIFKVANILGEGV
jgi:hypothetical protein